MAGVSNDDRLDALDPWIEEGYVEPHRQKSTDGNASV